MLDLVARLRRQPVGEQLAALLERITAISEPIDDDLEIALTAWRWFLMRAADGGIELTSAGYLKPVDVQAAAAIVPAVADWIGQHNREIQTVPLLRFRESLQRLGMLRKYKGKLVLAPAGRRYLADPAALWAALASRLVGGEVGSYQFDAGLLLLASIAGSTQDSIALQPVAMAMTGLGWRGGDGTAVRIDQVPPHTIVDVEVLRNVTERANIRRLPGTGSIEVGPLGRALARQALMSDR